jgi:undecaprenyl pyrophosphate synthase
MLNVGLIPDGNRRFMKKKGLQFTDFRDYIIEHKLKTSIEFILDFEDYKVKELTVFVLSEDNIMKRKSEEVEVIYDILKTFIEAYIEEQYVYRLNIISTNRSLIKDEINKLIDKVEEINQTNREVEKTLNLLVSFDGTKVNNYTLDDMDILIRTGFEKRTSKFCPLQIANAEIFFVDKHFPEMEKEDFDEIFKEFNKRERRFGK